MLACASFSALSATGILLRHYVGDAKGRNGHLTGEGRNWRACDSSYHAISCQVNSVPDPTSEILAHSTRTIKTKRFTPRQSVNTCFSYSSPRRSTAVNPFEESAAFRQRDVFLRKFVSHCENIFSTILRDFHSSHSCSRPHFPSVNFNLSVEITFSTVAARSQTCPISESLRYGYTLDVESPASSCIEGPRTRKLLAARL